MPKKSLVDVLFQEIIDEIIDRLENDKKSLISCTRTCRAFLPRAQSHIFRHVSISTHRIQDPGESDEVIIIPTRRIETLSDIVKKRPTLPRNFRMLNLEISDDGAWLSEDINFTSTMTLLDRSKGRFPAISITDQNLGMPYVPFPNQPEFRTSFWKPLVAPFVTKLVLIHLESIPIGIFLTCPMLCSLKVGFISIDTEKTFGAYQDGGLPQLETFAFNRCSEAVDDIFGLVNANKPYLNPRFLRSLELSPKERDPISCLSRLMAAAGSSLENLVINDIECNPTLSTFFNLSKLPALKSIHIDSSLYNVRDVHPLDGLSDLLRSAGRSTRLEKIIIVMSIDPTPLLGLDHQWWDAKNPGWAQLDKALNHLTTLSGFRKLNVQIHFMKVAGRTSAKGRASKRPTHWGDQWEAEVGTLHRDRFPISVKNPGVDFACTFEVLEREY